MEKDFTTIMSQRTDAELLKIVKELRNDYQANAVIAAELELQKRNLTSKQVQAAVHENETKKQIATEKANEKLNVIWKVLTFIFPGILQIMFAGTFKADGYDRKAHELTNWTLYGFGFYFGIALLIVLLT